MLTFFISNISSISFKLFLIWYRVPCSHRFWTSIPFWTGFSLGLLRAQLGSLDSLPTGLMFLTPGSHVYLSHGYPLPSSIIKQTHNLFFCPASHSQVTFWKAWWTVKAAVNMGWGVGVGRRFKRRGHTYTYGWLTLMYSRKHHNIVKQLSSN